FNKIPLYPPFPKWDLKYSPLWQRGVRGDFKNFPLFHSIFKAKFRNGFTLLEVIIVIGIITLMAGILVPMVYRVWESQEIDTTKERMTKLKEAMVGNISQLSNGVRSNFGFVGELGQLPPDFDALISFTNTNGTFGPYLSGGIDPQSFKKDAWGNNLIYNFTTDTFGRRESAIIKSLGADNIIGGTGTAEDIQISIDSNEVFSASSASCNILVRYTTAPDSTFSANITIHVAYKDGEGLEIEQSFISPVTITGYVGNSQNNYTFGMNSALTQKLPIGMARIWAVIDKNSSGNPLITTGPPAYIAVNDRVSTVYANNLSISVP
ncbi:MAG: prepilin-type N-terminal cleavage/methylation domain-containing protein, partial [Bacteroidetes bacterium]